jgi:site-specific DNA-methyltransferase (cytosine-N4-specific)
VIERDTSGGFGGKDKHTRGAQAFNAGTSGVATNGQFCRHCNAWKGQYGLEPTFQLYIEHTLLWCQEAKRVLRDDGVFFLNLGDSYSGSGGAGGDYGDGGLREGQPKYKQGSKILPSKCLLDIPFRVSIALVDNQQWIKRNNIPWYSSNKMPESVTDRFSKKHEMIFMMVKNPKYYFDLDAIREPHKTASVERACRGTNKKEDAQYAINRNIAYRGYDDMQSALESGELSKVHPKGKNPGDVFIFNTQPSPEKHYAMWPEALVERMIKCSTKPGDIVLDPFAGSGTTLRVADKLNREACGIDLGYAEIQERRLSNIQKELLISA